ncbi:MAG: helicase-related protein [Dehalococcoidia bacterium]
MRIPFVIDNQHHTMADVLNGILAGHRGRSLDVATAYFNVGGWALLQEGLCDLGNFRLLLGNEPAVGTDLGLHPTGNTQRSSLIRDLAAAPYDERTLRLVEDLIAFLRRDDVRVRLFVRGFLHAKCYLFYGGESNDRLLPVAAIVGSSNFTRPGLVTNRELNLSHRADLAASEIAPERMRPMLDAPIRGMLVQIDETHRLMAANLPGVLAINDLSDWYERQWADARDFKDDLIDLIDASKFGSKEYTPFQVYTKALYEYFRDDLDAQDDGSGHARSAVDLSEFQEDAVKRARRILDRYNGVMIADSVGLGKTWIGKKLLEDYAYHMRYGALVICPASLQRMWQQELLSAGIAAQIVTQEALGREEFDPRDVQGADVILVDESHNFRNRNAQRYEQLEKLLAANGRRGAVSGDRKKLILLTATPINNTVFDLYNQVNLLTGGDRSYFAAAGIGDLHGYFLAARRAARQQESGVALFNLLEEVVIRRTRPFIKLAYPNATIQGNSIRWPERKLKTIRYDLEATYGGIYDTIVKSIESLRLAPYRLESYKKKDANRDEWKEGRGEALAGIFKSRYLKRFESSVDAFRISVRRALEFLETFDTYLADQKVLDSADFQRALRFLAVEDDEDDATVAPGTRSNDLDASAEARAVLDTLPKLDPAQHDLQRLHNDLRQDVDALREVWHEIATITPAEDAKLRRLQELLADELKGQKVLVFTYYKDTARYLFRQLSSDEPSVAAWRARAGEPVIKRMDSGADSRERVNLVAHFAPRANGSSELVGSSAEVDVLISTDVLSEGQNLQDCGVLINYDLHWNPTRMVQRAGRIDRIGTTFATLWVHNMFPDEGLERLLKLVESLSRKIAEIDQSGFLDVSILGEVVHPQNFNTLRRIAEEDGSVIEEQEQFVELVSSEFLLRQLKSLLDGDMGATLRELPDGIHSGLARQGPKGLFFYFTAPATSDPSLGRQHFWRYVDLSSSPKGGRIEENRYLITQLIQCQPDTPRVVPADGEVNIFALQEKAIDSIISASIEQVAVEEAPKVLDPIQATVATALRAYVNSPVVNRKDVIATLKALASPQPGVYVKALRKAYEDFLPSQDVSTLLTAVHGIVSANGQTRVTQGRDAPNHVGRCPIKREDLRLICFDYVWH